MTFLLQSQTFGSFSVPLLAIFILAYLLGSIPFGLLIGKVYLHKDVRQYGSSNIGATNLTRIGGKKLGAMTLLLDFGKGLLAVLLASLFLKTQLTLVFISGILAVLGHTNSIWLRFKGGKGVATNFGIWLILEPKIFVSLAILWIITFILKRIASLAAITSLILTTLLSFILFKWQIQTQTCLFLSVYIILLHHKNIKQLLDKK